MLTPEFKNQLSKKLDGASPEAKNFFIDLLTESLLAGSMPEEHKVDVRILKTTSELRQLLDKSVSRFGNPIPPTEEGNKLIQEVYPARKAFLEWLQLTKAALERHLEETSMPQISEQWLDEQQKILLEK